MVQDPATVDRAFAVSPTRPAEPSSNGSVPAGDLSLTGMERLDRFAQVVERTKGAPNG